jgi:ribosomal protein S18 acetylase RimI-like enzyme
VLGVGEIEISEPAAEAIDDSMKQLWLGLVREMFDVEQLILPSDANADKWAASVRKGLTDGQSILLVAKSVDQRVGFIYARIFLDSPLEVSKLVGRIDDLYVLPEFRGRRIGKKLVTECLKEMRAAGVDAVSLTVLAENKVAVKLYEKLGFKIHAHRMITQLPKKL